MQRSAYARPGAHHRTLRRASPHGRWTGLQKAVSLALAAAAAPGCALLDPVPHAPAPDASESGLPVPAGSRSDTSAPVVTLPQAASRLPPGKGRAILEDACTGCHNLEGLWAYQGYYDEARWSGLVNTMIAHGAQLDETEAAELIGYLVEHFGPGTR